MGMLIWAALRGLIGSGAGGVIVTLLALAAPFLGYGWGVVKTTYQVRAEERAACTVKVERTLADMAAQLSEAARLRSAAAREAADAVTPTPETPAEIAKLCAKSASCRDR